MYCRERKKLARNKLWERRTCFSSHHVSKKPLYQRSKTLELYGEKFKDKSKNFRHLFFSLVVFQSWTSRKFCDSSSFFCPEINYTRLQFTFTKGCYKFLAEDSFWNISIFTDVSKSFLQLSVAVFLLVYWSFTRWTNFGLAQTECICRQENKCILNLWIWKGRKHCWRKCW